MLLWNSYSFGDAAPDYAQDIAPIFTKYCTGCHGGDEPEADLSLDSYESILGRLEDRPLLTPGDADSSHLLRVITGVAEPQMPPEEEETPTAAEVEVLRQWINAGALGPTEGDSSPPRLVTPQIKPQVETDPAVTAIAISPGGDRVARATYGKVEFLESVLQLPARTISDIPGKVNAVSFSADGEQLLVATGVTGLYGEARLYNVQDSALLHTYRGHSDTLYAAALSPDGSLVATASYDHDILLWDVDSGKQIHRLEGHNGAVFDVAFDPQGEVIASASADETVKVWSVATGKRLDTLSQPTAEQYTVAISPDGRTIVAGGADQRIRQWTLKSRQQLKINPLKISRFAHESGVLSLAYSPDGKTIVSTGRDELVRVWNAETLMASAQVYAQSSVVSDLCMGPHDLFAVARMDGSWQLYPAKAAPGNAMPKPVADDTVVRNDNAGMAGETSESAEMVAEQAEVEPNNTFPEAQLLSLPAVVKGKIGAAQADADIYAFHASAGQQWVFEIKAASKESLLDSHIEVFNADGRRIERVVLQAVSDSYIEFRGIDSSSTNGVRLNNWREISIDEYLYMSGEVGKLWYYPRGPDSGFVFYPGHGERHGYFGTTPLSHALNEPVYIVKAFPPGTDLPPSGLPTFPVYFENDDDPQRQLGTDSRLMFTAPTEGNYFVRVRDVRDLGGEKFHYELTARHPQPGFEVSVKLDNQSIPAGAGREFQVDVVRKDGFEGAIRVDIDGLPPGFRATTPVVIEAGQNHAFGSVYAKSDAAPLTEANAKSSTVLATAKVAGREVVNSVEGFGELKLGNSPKVLPEVLPTSDSKQPSENGPLELTIAPGETISAIVKVTRQGEFKDRVEFGQVAAGRNMPHGVYIDNIGLNGLLITEDRDQREFFITADSLAREGSRLFHLRAQVDDDDHVTSMPVLLHVRSPGDLASGR